MSTNDPPKKWPLRAGQVPACSGAAWDPNLAMHRYGRWHRREWADGWRSGCHCIGLTEKLEENPIFNGKIYGFRLRFSLKPIHWGWVPGPTCWYQLPGTERSFMTGGKQDQTVHSFGVSPIDLCSHQILCPTHLHFRTILPGNLHFRNHPNHSMCAEKSEETVLRLHCCQVLSCTSAFHGAQPRTRLARGLAPCIAGNSWRLISYQSSIKNDSWLVMPSIHSS